MLVPYMPSAQPVAKTKLSLLLTVVMEDTTPQSFVSVLGVVTSDLIENLKGG